MILEIRSDLELRQRRRMNAIWIRMHFDISLYELYVEGYLEATRDVLTPEEIESLPWERADDVRVRDSFSDGLFGRRYLL